MFWIPHRWSFFYSPRNLIEYINLILVFKELGFLVSASKATPSAHRPYILWLPSGILSDLPMWVKLLPQEWFPQFTYCVIEIKSWKVFSLNKNTQISIWILTQKKKLLSLEQLLEILFSKSLLSFQIIPLKLTSLFMLKLWCSCVPCTTTFKQELCSFSVIYGGMSRWSRKRTITLEPITLHLK